MVFPLLILEGRKKVQVFQFPLRTGPNCYSLQNITELKSPPPQTAGVTQILIPKEWHTHDTSVGSEIFPDYEAKATRCICTVPHQLRPATNDTTRQNQKGGGGKGAAVFRSSKKRNRFQFSPHTSSPPPPFRVPIAMATTWGRNRSLSPPITFFPSHAQIRGGERKEALSNFLLCAKLKFFLDGGNHGNAKERVEQRVLTFQSRADKSTVISPFPW